MPQPTETPVQITSLDPFTYDPAGPFDLQARDKIVLSLGPDIPSGASITKVTIWSDDDGQKGEDLGSWVGPPPGTNKDILDDGVVIYEIEGEDDGSVSIKDEDHPRPGHEVPYHFGATVTVGSVPYCGDPVMINKPG